MKKLRLSSLVCLATASACVASTYNTQNTLIPVPSDADGTDAGDTFTNSSNHLHLDAKVYIPDGVAAPAPVVIIVPQWGASKNDNKVKTLAKDFAEAGYVVLTPTMRGFGGSAGNVTLAGPDEINDLKTI